MEKKGNHGSWQPPLLNVLQRRYLERYLMENWKDMLDLGILFRLQTAVRWEQLAPIYKTDVQRNVVRLNRYQRGYEGVPEPDNWGDGSMRRSIPLEKKNMELMQLIRRHSPEGIYLFGKGGENYYRAEDFKRRMIRLCGQLGLGGCEDRGDSVGAAAGEGLSAAKFLRRLETMKEKPRIHRRYIPTVMDHLLDHGEGLIDLGLLLGFRTDILPGELVCLTCEQVLCDSWNNGMRAVYCRDREYIVENKNPGRVHLIYREDCEALVHLIWEQGDRRRKYLFEDAGERIPAKVFDERLEEICGELGIPMRV